jgi:hypothetical protein
MIPGDGEIIEGVASVDESAITGESAPVIRESGGDRSGRHRGHRGAVRPDRGRDHQRPGRIVPGPDDRPGGRGHPPAHAERDRPHPGALGLYAGLSDRGGAALAHGLECRAVHDGLPGPDRTPEKPGHGHPHPYRPGGLPDSHHHRRPAGRHRHRRHGPGPAGQHHRQERQGGGIGGDIDVMLLDKTGTITDRQPECDKFTPWRVFRRRRGAAGRPGLGRR